MGRLLTSLCLFLFIWKMMLVVVCGHLLGLSWSSQEACLLNPQCGVLHHQVQSQCKVTFAVFTSFSLASGQRPVGALKEGLFTIQDYFLQEAGLGCTSSEKPPPLSEAHSESCLHLASSWLLGLPPSLSLSVQITYFVFKNLASYEMGAIWGQRWLLYED